MPSVMEEAALFSTHMLNATPLAKDQEHRIAVRYVVCGIIVRAI